MSLFRKGIFVSLFKIANSLLGFGLSILIAIVLGANEATDALFIAMVIPIDIARTSLVRFASISLVPSLVSMRPEQKRTLLAHVMGWWFVILCAGMLVALVAAGPLIRLMGPGLSAEAIAHGRRLLALLSPCLLLFGVFAAAQAVAVAERRFYSSEVAAVVFRVVAIVCLLVFGRRWGVRGFAVGLVAASVLQCAVMIWDNARHGVNILAAVKPTRNAEELKPVMQGGMAVLIAVVLRNVGLAIGRMFASFMAAGSVSALTYAGRIANAVPLLLARSFFRVFVPALSEAQRSKEEMRRLGGLVSLFLLSIGFPFAILLVWGGDDLVGVLLEHGKLKASALADISGALKAYAFAIPAIMCTMGLRGIFLVQRNVREVRWFSVLGLLLKTFLCIVLFERGVSGIAYAACFAEYLMIVYLQFRARVQLPPFGVWGYLLLAMALSSVAAWAVPWRSLIANDVVALVAGGLTISGTYAVTFMPFMKQAGRLMKRIRTARPVDVEQVLQESEA